MAQAQQGEPRLEGFGLSKDVQNHVPEEDREQAQTRPNRSEKRRTVAVNRRGPNAKRAADTLDEESDGEESAASGSDDLDASDTDDESSSDDEGDLDEDEGDADDVDSAAGDGEDAGDEDDDKLAARKAAAAGREDKRTRKQLQAALSKQNEKLEELQRRLDGQDSRIQQSQDAQRQRQQGDTDEDLDEALDGLFSAGEDKDGFLKAGELEARGKQRKKLEKLISGRISDAVNGYSAEEAKAFLAVPGARDAYNEAVRTGVIDRLRGQHKHLAPLMFAALREQHDAQIKKLNARHEKEIGVLKKKMRRAALDEIPAGTGSRGLNGTGSGAMRPRNPMEAAMATLNSKQGLPAPRAAQRR